MSASVLTTPAPRAGAVRRLLQCMAGDDSYCILASSVQGIQRADQMSKVASDGPVVGYVREMAAEIPVYSLSQLVGRPMNPANGGVLLFRSGDVLWGLLVDVIARTIEVAASLFVPLPMVLQAGSLPIFQTAVLRDNDMILYLAPEVLSPALWTDPIAVPPRPPQESRYVTPGFRIPSLLRQQSAQQMLLFTVWDTDGEHLTFGLSISQMLEIMKLPTLLPVPGAPPYVVGLLPWRDRPVPVIDLGVFFKLPGRQHGKAERLLVARGTSESALIAIPIQQTVSTVNLPIPHQLCTREVAIDRRFARGIFDVEGDTLVIPDFDAIVKA